PFSPRKRRDVARDRVSLGQLRRRRQAAGPAHDRHNRHRCSAVENLVDERCTEGSTALAILAGAAVGAVPTVRLAGIHQPPRSDRLVYRLDKHTSGWSFVWRGSSSESGFVWSNFSRRRDLGLVLSPRAKPFRSCTIACCGFDPPRVFLPAAVDK